MFTYWAMLLANSLLDYDFAGHHCFLLCNQHFFELVCDNYCFGFEIKVHLYLKSVQRISTERLLPTILLTLCSHMNAY